MHLRTRLNPLECTPLAGQTQHHVARFDVGAGQDLGFFNSTHGKPGQVVFTGRVHAGHLGGFTTDQRAAGQLAAPGNTTHHGGCGVHIELAAGKVVQKEQGLGTLHQHVVHAHGNQVNAHGVVHGPFKRQLEFGAHAVGAADQHGLFVAFGYFKQGTKAANARQHAFAHGFFGQRLDAFNQGVARVDVDTSIFVGQGGRGELIWVMLRWGWCGLAGLSL
jgi:hypothetical protein